MGTEIQNLRLSEADFRGERFADHGHDLKGNNDLLILTQPDAIRAIHLDYFRAGSDIVETNTFSGTSIAQADYGMEDAVYDLNRDGARLARRAALRAQDKDGRRRFVAGALGPTNRTASISPDVNNPGFRAVSFDDLRTAYGEQLRGLIDGGAVLILIETIFDTLNAKAGIMAAIEAGERAGRDVPLMISMTITDLSGRNLSGHTVEAFWHAVRHARPVTIGLNCSFGAQQLRPHVQALAAAADTLVMVYPNAGLPNELGAYDERPEQTAAFVRAWADQGLVNILGGCCGSTPAHIQAIAQSVAGLAPRRLPTPPVVTRLAGLEPMTIAA
ncbi:MAG TPA: homocysteine S-methyltransferase family protein [Allosphingosinicella sp.]